jgi:hypothetical protein
MNPKLVQGSTVTLWRHDYPIPLPGNTTLSLLLRIHQPGNCFKISVVATFMSQNDRRRTCLPREARLGGFYFNIILRSTLSFPKQSLHFWNLSDFITLFLYGVEWKLRSSSSLCIFFWSTVMFCPLDPHIVCNTSFSKAYNIYCLSHCGCKVNLCQRQIQDYVWWIVYFQDHRDDMVYS